MAQPVPAIAYLDGPRLKRALEAGFHHVFNRRDYLNRINVFPVPDGDTGTNMAFTFREVEDALRGAQDARVDHLLRRIADAALDGARGNSGAIMAQFFQGVSEAADGLRLLTPEQLGMVVLRGAESAWKAMAEPVEGTLPSVLSAFADALSAGSEADLMRRFAAARNAAQAALERTPEQLPALKQAGVVDAGGQGFVDLLDGIWTFMESGAVETIKDPGLIGGAEPRAELGIGRHRYCTECVIEGRGLDRNRVMAALAELDGSSLVVAGSERRIRVHMHVNAPGELFLACEAFGEITRQKADDMNRQHGLINQPGQVAIVTDSGGDLPEAEVERLGIHIVPVRLSFGADEYLDGVSLTAEGFYRLLEESPVFPQTSQPPPQDFRRVYSLLGSHGYDVLNIGLSGALSGTTQAARTAAERTDDARVVVLDTLNASAGQGLLAIVAAEAAAQGMAMDEIVSLVSDLVPRTRIFAMADDLSSGVRGGRVPGWVKSVADLLRLNPVLTATPKGTLGVGGVSLGRGAKPENLARQVLRRMEPNTVYRLMIAHARNPEGAQALRRALLQGGRAVHSCLLAEAGPALGAHLGAGGLIAAILPQPDLLAGNRGAVH